MLLDLSHSLATGMTQVANVPPVDVCRILSIDDGAWANAQSLHITGHSGTHVDAPLHVLAGTASIEELPLERFIGPGVALSLLKEPGTTIVAADLEAANGGRVRRGDIVLLHTGWDRYWGTPTYFDFPALALDAADWLLEHGVRLVGMDMLSPDLPAQRRTEHGLPIHKRLLGNDVLIAENLTRLAPLAEHRLQVYAVPIKVAEGDGAPARVMAEIVD